MSPPRAVSCALRGAVLIPLPDSLEDRGAYVYIPGSPIHAYLDSATTGRAVLLDSVPAGSLPGAVYFATGRIDPPLVLTSAIQAHPSQNPPVSGFASWAHNRRLFSCAPPTPVWDPRPWS